MLVLAVSKSADKENERILRYLFILFICALNLMKFEKLTPCQVLRSILI